MMEKISIKPDDYEKYLGRLDKGAFGGSEFNPKKLKKAVFGEDPNFFLAEFMKLKRQREKAKKDKEALSGLFVEKKEDKNV